MRTNNYLILALLLVTTLTSCGSGKKERAEVAEPDSIVEDFDTISDLGVTGLIYAIKDKNVSLITEAGDSLSFSLADALNNGKVLGGFALGNKILVIPGNAEGTADELINLSTLMGSWVSQNGAGEAMGFNLQDGGVATSINTETLTYKKWEMDGDKILLTSVSEGSGSPMEMTDTCDILILTSDSLQLNTHFEEGNQLMTYTRKK